MYREAVCSGYVAAARASAKQFDLSCVSAAYVFSGLGGILGLILSQAALDNCAHEVRKDTVPKNS